MPRPIGLNKKYDHEVLTLDQIKYAHGLYQTGMSLTEVANKIGSTRQRLHSYFKLRNLERRPLKKTEQIEYNGLFYTKNKNGYWRETTRNRESLHRQIWIDNNGAIPEGMEVHHKDENKNNNSIENLEIMSTSDHAKLHGFTNNQHTIKWDEDERKRKLKTKRTLPDSINIGT